jgi:hypothetical protein
VSPKNAARAKPPISNAPGDWPIAPDATEQSRIPDAAHMRTLILKPPRQAAPRM